MDLHQLFVFTKVVEHNSFSKAAEDIFLSQSTVSSHIKGLEKSLNLKLFDRDSRHAILTPHGERLYHWAKQILLVKDQALLDLQKNGMDFQGNIKIATSSVPGSFILPDLIKHFHKEYPAVTFHISESPSKIVADTVLKRAVDVGILGRKYEDDKLCYHPIQKEKLVLITSNEIDLKTPVHLDEITRYPLIFRHTDSGSQAAVNTLLRKKGFSKESLTIVLYTDSNNSLIQYVRNGTGVAIISEITAREYAALRQIRMYDIEDFQDERLFYLVYHKNRTLSLVAKLFIEEMKEWAEENGTF